MLSDIAETAHTAAQEEPPVKKSTNGKALFAMGLGVFAVGAGEFAPMGLLPEIATAMRVSEPTAGAVISAYALGVMVGAPVLAAATARLPRRTVLLGLVLLLILGNALTVFAPNYSTLVAARFLSGLPHGAFFGAAGIVAAHLGRPGQRAKAISQVMLGLSIATVVGAPCTTWLGKSHGWQSAFAVIAVVGAASLLGQAVFLPRLSEIHAASPLTELGALRRPQVWFSLVTGLVGFGGMFSIYTYVSGSMTEVAHLKADLVPLALTVFGLGMVVGGMLGGRIPDANLLVGITTILLFNAAAQAALAVVMPNPYAAVSMLFFVGAGSFALIPALQTRLMDVAGHAQNLAASLNHSALNAANALGAWLGGTALAAGLGYRATAEAGALLALSGVAVFSLAVLYERWSGLRRAAHSE